jgi:hypothetical protein
MRMKHADRKWWWSLPREVRRSFLRSERGGTLRLIPKFETQAERFRKYGVMK